MYSCRAELDMELEKMKSKIQLANRDRCNVKALQEAIDAECLLPVMENLRDEDDKFRSVHDLQETIDELKGKLQDMDSLAGCLPIARKIEELQKLVDLNGRYKDEKRLAGLKTDVEAESGSVTGKETLPVSERTTLELVDLNVSVGDETNLAGQKAKDEKNLAGPKAKDEFEFVSVTGNETLPVSVRSTDELSNACHNPEERLRKLEDMMIEQRNMMAQLEDMIVQLSGRVGRA